MRRLSPVACGVTAVVFGLSLAVGGSASAEESMDDQPAAANTELTELQIRTKVLREWRDTLTDTSWELDLKPARGQEGDVETDVLTFGRRSVESENLLKKGYAKSADYALYSPTEESVSWETMQLKDEDMAIWRGEVVGETITGMLTKQRQDGKGKTAQYFSFTGSMVKRAPEVQEEAPEAASDSEDSKADPEA